MKQKNRRIAVTVLNILLFLAAILLFGNTGFSLHIKHAYPFILLSLLTAYSCFTELTFAALAGFLSGAFVDSIASNSFSFNALALMLLAVAANRLSNTVFNKNLKASVTLCFFITLIYYLFYWLFFIRAALGFRENLQYLMQYVLPSCLYTTAFVVPFYYLYKKLNKS